MCIIVNKVNRPIRTYGKQGVARSGVIKDQHGIIYTGQEPEPYEDELPSEEESSMLPSVRVENLFPEDDMHRCACINYAEVFTVEHDVKVYDVGDIEPSHLALFRDNFRIVWDFEREISKVASSRPGN